MHGIIHCHEYGDGKLWPRVVLALCAGLAFGFVLGYVASKLGR